LKADALNLKVCVEFLDGSASIIFVPMWLRGSRLLYALKPCGEEACLQLDGSKLGLPLYREQGDAVILPFRGPVKKLGLAALK
jgi:hypothetical protein